jgi:transposase-like protein
MKGRKTTMRTDRDDALARAAREAVTKGISAESAAQWREFARERMRGMLIGVMYEEVKLLCGPSHRPDFDAAHFRSGTAPGYVLYEGRRMDVRRPRVRRRDGNGTTETLLTTYANAQDSAELDQRVLEAFQVGVSSRDQKRLHGEGTPGVSKSEVSRLWRREGEKCLAAFRARDIAREDWLVLMLDGLHLGDDLMTVVALGIAGDGTKHLLDFELGASETAETAKGLLERLSRRGFAPAEGCRLLAVLDGSAALKTAVLSYWPDAVIQRCLIHKERNLKRHLARKDWKELSRRFGRLRRAEIGRAHV